nr:hypothetical protein FVER53263_02769 [Fusarium verticillioides]
MKPYKPGVCKCLGHCPSRDFDLNIHLHITWSRLTTHTALTPPAPELIVSALQLGWPMSSLQLVSSSYPATFWYKASYVLNCLRVAAEYQVLAMQVISLLSMEVAVVESRVWLIRWKSAKELGQEGKSPLLSLRFNSS